MKLPELVKYILNNEQLDEVYKRLELNVESEALLIYMKSSLSLESDIIIFGIEETEDDIVFEKDNLRYIQLFPMDYAIDLIEHDLDLMNKRFSDLEIAQRLLEYRQKDA